MARRANAEFEDHRASIDGMLARRLARAFAGLALVLGSCSVPEFDFQGTGDDGGLPPLEHCANSTLDGDLGETDLNCGGPCPPCGTGFACVRAQDCASGQCVSGLCTDASCTDNEISGDETGVDCGGSCSPCPPGEPCNKAADCDSGVCTDGMCAAPTCNDRVKNGNESDIDCGGLDCDRCGVGRTCTGRNDCVSTECTDGICTLVCLEGTGNCDGDMDNGCETNLKTSAQHCNECGAACSLPNAVAACSAGTCVVESCVEPFLDCDGKPENGCEVNGATDVDNCGACGMACVGINGNPFCANSACQITCDTGFADCNDNRADGCEKNTQSDVNNCGECGKVCDAGDGTPWCNMGKCGISNCPPGRGDCNADPSDGCEVDLTNDVANCKTCGNICVAANGTPACDDSTCKIASCNAGRANCNTGDGNGGYADGCETNTASDPANCGTCGNQCNIANATSTCESGMCRVQTCTPPFADCNNDRLDCEINTSNNATNCGGCGSNGVNCTTAFPNATGICSNSMCMMGACTGGRLNCNQNPIDGCEVNPQTNDNHCGGCGQACLDVNGTNTCVSGTCMLTCNTGFLNCDDNVFNGCEVNGREDDNNCSACGKVCQEINTTDPPGADDGNTCHNGVCVVTCNSSSLSCDGDPSNGCEVNKLEDDNNCNGCGIVCQDNHANNECNNGVCQPQCHAGFGNCDGNPNNGCETSTTTTSNCGVCGRMCATTNASSTSCTSGTCNPSCNTGWAACSNPHNGCTTQLGTTNNCASCGNACTGGTPFCVGAPGSASCQAQLTIQLVDNTPADSTDNPTVVRSKDTAPYVLDFDHELRSGPNTYRVIVLAVAADGNSASSARPETVTYGGITATLAQESYTSRAWAGIYTVVIPNSQPAGTNRVFISDAEFGLIVNVAEFTGVDRLTPVEAAANGLNNNCGSDDPNDSVTTVSPNAWIYSIAAFFNPGSPVGSPGGSGQIETLDLKPAGQFGAIAGYKPNVPIGTHAISWNIPTCDRGSHALVALEPADVP